MTSHLCLLLILHLKFSLILMHFIRKLCKLYCKKFNFLMELEIPLKQIKIPLKKTPKNIMIGPVLVDLNY